MPEDTPEISADELRAIARALDLVAIPDHLMPRVLRQVRSHRAAMQRFERSGLDVADVFTAQPYRA